MAQKRRQSGEQVAADIGKLDQKGSRQALAPGQAFEVTQKGGLMLAAEQNARRARHLAGREGGQANTGTWATHGVVFSASQIPLGCGGRRHRTSALAVFGGPAGGLPAPRK